jgi:SAM-dependent methyltransferase
MDPTMSSPHPCPICADTRRHALFVARDRHYHIPGEWTVAACAGCGMVQLDPMPSASDLMALYPTDFYAYSDLSVKNKGAVAALKRALFPTLYVEDPGFPRPGRVLDSGCGTGWALLKFRDAGWECIGVEPSTTAARFGREKYGLDVRAGTIHSEHFPDAHFDYIRSNHSLEHDPDADATIAEFRRTIREDGRLLVGVPNIDSWAARHFGADWWYLGAPVHTYNFSRNHLEALLKKHDFETESVRYTGNYGGTTGSLQIRLNRADPAKASTDGRLINSTAAKVAGQFVSMVLNLFGQGDAIEVVARPVRRASGAVR